MSNIGKVRRMQRMIRFWCSLTSFLLQTLLTRLLFGSRVQDKENEEEERHLRCTVAHPRKNAKYNLDLYQISGKTCQLKTAEQHIQLKLMLSS